MVELIRYAVIGSAVALAVYEIFSSKVKIDRLSSVVEEERNKLNALIKENDYLRSSRYGIESQVRALEMNMYDKDWLELNWEKTQARKEYEEKIEQIDRVNKIQKGK